MSAWEWNRKALSLYSGPRKHHVVAILGCFGMGLTWRVCFQWSTVALEMTLSCVKTRHRPPRSGGQHLFHLPSISTLLLSGSAFLPFPLWHHGLEWPHPWRCRMSVFCSVIIEAVLCLLYQSSDLEQRFSKLWSLSVWVYCVRRSTVEGQCLFSCPYTCHVRKGCVRRANAIHGFRVIF